MPLLFMMCGSFIRLSRCCTADSCVNSAFFVCDRVLENAHVGFCIMFKATVVRNTKKRVNKAGTLTNEN